MRLQEIMSTTVETITPDTSVAEAKTRMKREGIHHLVIGRGKRLIGVISSRDLSAALATAPVAELVAGKPVTATPKTTVREAANLLRGRNIGCLPVTEDAAVVGIVTVSDLLELLGKGAERPTPRSTRWTLKGRGPRKTRPGPGRERLEYGR
jgi:acetoin utilization protein AcuB